MKSFYWKLVNESADFFSGNKLLRKRILKTVSFLKLAGQRSRTEVTIF